jgi:hypothetical protein
VVLTIGWEVEMSGGGRQSSLGGHAGRTVVGDDDSLGAFYRLEGGHERGQEGMHLMAMVDLQCISFGVEGELGAETVEGRRGDEACISKQGRGHG